MQLLLASLGVSLVGGIVCLLANRAEDAAKCLGCLAGAVAAVLAAVAGIGAVVAPVETFAAPMQFFEFSLRLDPLSGILVAVIAVLAFAAWVFGTSYFDEYAGKGIGVMCFFMHMFVVSMMLVITVDNAFWFLVFFEMMSLTSYFLVVVEQDDASIKGGFMYLVMAHVGFFMIMVSFLVMASAAGSFTFEAFRTTQFAPAVASVCFVLAFLGFGFKAGMVPFHSWLPMAHPAAPSNVSALMSGGMIKIGIFGIVKVGFDLLGCAVPELWWGLLVLVFGAVSSVLGVAYALNEHDVKKLLAYHSVENIGIILLGVGTALVGAALDMPALTVLGLLAGLFHLINHAMFKGLLFLGAGSVLHATGTRNMEVLGGLRRSMPVTAVCFLIGSLAISAIPPLNGFVSEWFTYQGLITAAMGADPLVRLVCAFSVVMLAITGALAVTCFVKAYGVTFLGDPRSEVASAAREVPGGMRAAMVLLAAVCVVLGVGAPLVVPSLTQACASIAGRAAIESASGAVLANPVLGSAMSTPLVAVLLAAAVFVPWLVVRQLGHAGTSNAPDPWACGYNPTPDMPLVAGSVGAQVRMFWKPLYDVRDALCRKSPVFAAAFERVCRWANKAQNWGDVALVAPTSSFVRQISELSRKIEGGDFRVYVTYVVVVLVAFLVLAVLTLG